MDLFKKSASFEQISSLQTCGARSGLILILGDNQRNKVNTGMVSMRRATWSVPVLGLLLGGALFVRNQRAQAQAAAAALQTAGTPFLAAPSAAVQPVVSLGQALFQDVNLSNPPGQSCASCHSQAVGFKFPNSAINQQYGAVPGAYPGRFGFRSPPTISYVVFNPAGPPSPNAFGIFTGGLFYDGRATNLQDQAGKPFLNVNEMNDVCSLAGSPALVVQKVQNGPEAYLFRQVFGQNVFTGNSAPAVFQAITYVISVYESTPAVSPFSSWYDQYIHGKANLSAQQLDGLRLMTGSYSGRPGGPAYPKSASCFFCHAIQATPGAGPDLFTDASYENTGVPRNPHNPYYTQTNPNTDPAGYNPLGSKFVDIGLGATYYPTLGLPPGNTGPGSNGRGDYLGINGAFKSPTLRNVDQRPFYGFVKSYTHNGFFKDLASIVHFYNTRNLTTCPGEVIDFTKPNPYANLKGAPLWPAPENLSAASLTDPTGSNTTPGPHIGNLGLTPQEESDIVAFLQALSDGFSYQTYPGGMPTPVR